MLHSLSILRNGTIQNDPKEVFRQANFFAQSDFFFGLMGLFTGTIDKSLQFIQRKFDSRDYVRSVENEIKDSQDATARCDCSS